MQPSQQLPPEIVFYLQEQERKKRKERNKVIIICAIVFILLGIIANVFDDDKPKKNFPKSVEHQDTLTNQNINSVDSITPTGDNKPTINKQDIEFKARDAVAILDVYVKHNMDDPDSFEEVSYTYSYHETYFIILLKFRGKNAFGAKVLNYIEAKTDLDGEVLEVLSAG